MSAAEIFAMAQNLATRFRIEPGKRAHLAKRDPGSMRRRFRIARRRRKKTKDDGKAINVLAGPAVCGGLPGPAGGVSGDRYRRQGRHHQARIQRDGAAGRRRHGFGRPSGEELAHDFLWRVHLACPRRGTIGIFNRSHYEDVLIGRVRKLAPVKEIEARYEQINAFEKMLAENGTTILKFMLHISKKEQAERLQERLDEPDKRWKFDPRDLEDRKLWDQYQAAYELMLNKCSTAWAPWHVIPADRKWARNAAIAAIVRETLEAMGPKYPKPDWNPKDFKVD